MPTATKERWWGSTEVLPALVRECLIDLRNRRRLHGAYPGAFFDLVALHLEGFVEPIGDFPHASKGNAQPKEPVRIAMSKMRTAPARMVLLIRRDVLAKLGGRAERYRIHVGRVEDRHRLKLVQDDQGPFEANVAGQKSSVMRIRLPFIEQFPDCKIAAQGVAFEQLQTQRNALLVTLPAWAWNAEQKAQRERGR